METATLLLAKLERQQRFPTREDEKVDETLKRGNRHTHKIHTNISIYSDRLFITLPITLIKPFNVKMFKFQCRKYEVN